MLLRQVERGSAMFRSLALATTLVGLLLAIGYGIQLALAAMGTTAVTVTVSDPVLIAIELVFFALALGWLYIGLRNYRFTTKLARQVKAVRAADAELMRKQGLDTREDRQEARGRALQGNSQARWPRTRLRLQRQRETFRYSRSPEPRHLIW